MDRNDEQIPWSALFTAATWQWGGVPAAALTAPPGSEGIFNLVRRYNTLYRWLNPDHYQLHEMLLHRHAAIDHLLRESAAPRVIEVAAGFSPRGCAFSADPTIDYHEVDLRPVVRGKRARLMATDAGRAALRRPNLHLVEGNARDPALWHGFPTRRTSVVTEGLMMYFDRRAQMDIWRHIAQFLLLNGGEYLFDYIPLELTPRRSLAGALLSALRRLLLDNRRDYYPDNRCSEEIERDLLACGFLRVERIRCSGRAHAWGLPFPDADTRVVVFRCTCATDKRREPSP